MIAAYVTALIALTAPFQCAALTVKPQQSLVSSSRDEAPLHLAAAAASRSDASTLPAFMSRQLKPIRIDRGGATTGGGEQDPDKITHPSYLHCGTTSKVNSGSDKYERCPDECPFFAQDRKDDDFCTFVCVAEKDCNNYFPHTPIGDKELGVCRSCVVDGCLECDTSVTYDKCAVCQGGYNLQPDGKCHFKYAGEWMNYVGYAIAALLVLVVIWIADMQIRPCTNDAGLEHALDVREKVKLRQKKDEAGVRQLWPLTTNLMRTQVAGPGMMLHFNFQFALILWAAFVALVWIFFCQFVDSDLWRLGTRKFGTPRENCILVAWGYETQQALMWTKVSFLYIIYFSTFAMCIGYGVYQLREFQETDFQNKTMKDFVAMVCGLPKVSGSKNVEEDLKATLQGAGASQIVGVSVAWDFAEHEEDVTKALDADKHAVEASLGAFSNAASEPPPMNGLRKKFYDFERSLFGLPDFSSEESPRSEPDEGVPIEELLLNMHTSPRAFVVFETQDARDAAMEAAAGGFDFEGETGLYLETLEAEPDTVQWVNFGHSSPSEKAIKIALGFGIIGLACFFWAVVFYAPYAYYVMTFNYENGRQPGFVVGFAFSMIVVVGNAIMYEVCAHISDWVGFRFKDNREACYMILYTIACMFNVALDFVTTYYTAEKVMEGLGFRTYYGIMLKDVTEFTMKFETYGMQRSLAENTYAYAFPSTYLIPFLIEPFPAILAPLWVGRLIVRSHPEAQGPDAEGWLEMAPMEMGRYADLLLNVILGVLIFYFPGGYTWMLFFGMAASHVWVYVFDHYRVLRSIPSCVFASFDVEWWCQAMMAPILGIVMACLVFKTNCEPGYHCLRGPSLIAACSAGWLVHTIVHLCVLTFLIPMMGKPEPEEDPCAGMTFEQLAHRLPCSWFTSNPVHCLRSKHKYGHSPPCSFFNLGKEYHMKVNKSIGCFFEEAKGGKEI